MALAPLSTLASVQARANSKRVNLWTVKDKDGTPDPETLDQGFQFATGLIFEYVNRRYGETQLASWTRATAPARVLCLSDDLCVWYFSSANSGQNELIGQIYEEALASLVAIRDRVSDVYGATETVEGTSVTEDAEDPFEDEGEYFNE